MVDNNPKMDVGSAVFLLIVGLVFWCCKRIISNLQHLQHYTARK